MIIDGISPDELRRGRYSKSQITRDQRFWVYVPDRPDNSCWFWCGTIATNGYGVFRHDLKSYLAHRYSYLIHHGEIPDGMCVCHTCDVRNCVNPAHLWIGTNADNNRDCAKKGRLNLYYGERNKTAKIKDSDAALIREMSASGWAGNNLAKHFGVSPMTISNIINRKSWRHIP